MDHEEFIQQFQSTRYYQSNEYITKINSKPFFLQSIKDKNGEIVCSGYVVINTDKNGENYFYCPRGPVFDINKFEYFLEFIKQLKEKSHLFNVKRFVCNPPIEIEFSDLFKGYGFIINRDSDNVIEPPNAVILPAIDEEQIFNLMSKEAKKNTKKAIRYGLSFVEFNDKELFHLDEFYNQYLLISKKHNFKPRTKDYFYNLIKNIDKNYLYFTETTYNNEIVCMSIDFLYNGILSCLYSVTNGKYKEMKTSNMMHWGRMKFSANSEIIKFFECGGVYCDGQDINHPDYGVYKFKMSLCDNNIKHFVGDICCEFMD